MASSLDPSLAKQKALPLVAKTDDLPPPPPSPLRPLAGPPPFPPPKNAPQAQFDAQSGLSSVDERLSDQSLKAPELLSPPYDPTSNSGSPPSPSAVSSPPSSRLQPANAPRSKKANPFVDLLETEKTYVDTLSGIIRKVAAAWSRSNLPPPELDMIFRSVEAIYKANRSFQAKLKEIGPNPSSPRAIGDLLMKWIDQLDSPYTKYASSYLSGFDAWEPVQNNQRLPSILETYSASNPPSHSTIWTMDALLSLPRARISYYLKLYGRLLKNSGPGKPTDQKLIEGVRKLEELLVTIDERSKIALPGPAQTLETTDEIVIDTRESNEDSVKPTSKDVDETNDNHNEVAFHPRDGLDVRSSIESSTRGSSFSSGYRSSRDTAITSEGRASTSTLSMSLSDLERRLATERSLDLFTMTPRVVNLSISSPNLPYSRELKLSEDTTIYFTPKCTNVEVVHRQGRIFLLTDLFLVCERMSFEERARYGMDGVDMWLCYPPLAAKHIRAIEIEDTGIEVTILKKEVMRLCFDSRVKRDVVLKEFKSTTELAATLPPPSKHAAPPLPSMGNLPSSVSEPSGRRPSDPPNRSRPPSRGASASSRPASPASITTSMNRMALNRDSASDIGSMGQSPIVREGAPPFRSINDQARPLQQMASPPAPRPVDAPTFAPDQIVPPPRGESSRGGMYPSEAGVPSGPASFAPGQIVPPQRSESVRAHPAMGVLPPRGPMSPPPMNGMHGPPRGMMSPPPMDGLRSPPRNMMSPPPMNGMHGGPQQMGYGNAPMAAPRPLVGGLGSATMFAGPGPMYGRQGYGPGPGYPQHLPPHPHPPFANPGRPASDPSFQGGLRKTPSLHSLSSQHEHFQHGPRSAPPVPSIPNDFLPERQNSLGTLAPGQNQLRPMLPSAALPRIASSAPAFGLDESPPTSPTGQAPRGPVESVVLASMKCKVFLQQQHAQWKALGSSKLTLYEQRPTMLKQLVVEADNKDKTILISTIVLTDGVERVGKTGIAIELSDSGSRTGIVYMIQLRNERSAGGLYESLLSGSDRGGFRG